VLLTVLLLGKEKHWVYKMNSSHRKQPNTKETEPAEGHENASIIYCPVRIMWNDVCRTLKKCCIVNYFSKITTINMLWALVIITSQHTSVLKWNIFSDLHLRTP